jgi:quinol monooxygenase YgiN
MSFFIEPSFKRGWREAYLWEYHSDGCQNLLPYFIEEVYNHKWLRKMTHDGYKEVIEMIHVVATIRVKAGRLGDFLELLKSTARQVRKEKGCLQYVPTVDIVSGLPPQIMDTNVVTLIEEWESLEALRDHLVTPHIKAFFEKRKDMVEGASLVKVLQEA